MDCDEPAANSSSQYQQYSPPPSKLTVTLTCPLSMALDITRPTPTVSHGCEWFLHSLASDTDSSHCCGSFTHSNIDS